MKGQVAEKQIICPECGGNDLKTMQGWDSIEYGGCYIRRKKCKRCGTSIRTAELDTAVLKMMGVDDE